MKKTVIVNLNFDDFHPQDDKFGDFGGNPNGGTFAILKDLCQEFPGLIITLFTTPNWVDRPYTRHRYWYLLKELIGIIPVTRPLQNEPFLLEKHPTWCKAVRDEIAAGNFEIAVHGYQHFNQYSRVHGQEFAGINQSLTREKIHKAENVFKTTDIPFVKIFRPPGWGVNPYLKNILRELNYIAFANESSRAKTYTLREDDGLLILPQNWSIKEHPSEALRLAETHGIVFMKGHLTYQYGKEIIENGINKEHLKNLKTALNELCEHYNVQFVSLKQACELLPITHQK